jgi:hypothetical protein
MTPINTDTDFTGANRDNGDGIIQKPGSEESGFVVCYAISAPSAPSWFLNTSVLSVISRRDFLFFN